MLIFESTKTNTPIPQQDLALIFISPPHTYIHNPGITTIAETSEDAEDKHIQTKDNMDKLCETKQKQCYSPIKDNTKQHNLGVFQLLEFSTPLESCSDIYAGPTSCPIVTLHFNAWFLRYFPIFIFHFCLYIIHLLISTQIERSLLSIITRHAPHCWLAASVFWDTVRHCGHKAFFKNCLVHL